MTGNVLVHIIVMLSFYFRGVNTFSPEGRIFQVEYAIEAIKVMQGHTSAGYAIT